ncbi:MAG: hypothetical protein IAF58_12335 [Leptolyngbya sp.]|nr:hypothetical protein [Candidatus Melainabacteria bacterium]
MSKPVTKNSIMNQLVALEQFLNRLMEDVEHAKYRRNELVAHAIEDAAASLTLGFKSLAREKLAKAHLHVKNSWLQSSYARQLFDAETVEFELGEGNYLELLDVNGEFLPAANGHFTYLENDLKRIRAEIQSRSGKVK